MIEDNLMAYVTAPGVVTFKAGALQELQPNDVRIHVRAAAICGSDLHLLQHGGIQALEHRALARVGVEPGQQLQPRALRGQPRGLLVFAGRQAGRSSSG